MARPRSTLTSVARMPARHRWVALCLVVAALAAACSSDPSEPGADEPPAAGDGSIVAVFDTPAGRFSTLISDPESVERVLDGEQGTHVGIPIGRLVEGDGGVNAPHDWHLIDVEIADMTIEICDGTVDYINDLGLDRFIEEHDDQFCPWGAVLIDVHTVATLTQH